MYVCKNIKVSCRTIAGVAYVLNEQTRELHKLNQMGTVIWDHISGERSIDELVDLTLKEVEGDPAVVREGVLGFIDELSEMELVLYSEDRFEGVYVSAC